MRSQKYCMSYTTTWVRKMFYTTSIYRKSGGKSFYPLLHPPVVPLFFHSAITRMKSLEVISRTYIFYNTAIDDFWFIQTFFNHYNIETIKLSIMLRITQIPKTHI